MSLYVIADLHLPLSVDKPMDVFGNRWTDYVNKIRKNWVSLVNPSDTVIVPGDISWATDLSEMKNDFSFLDSLPGKKILGKGNHDFWWDTITKNKKFLSDNNFNSIDFLFNNAFEVDEYIVCGTRGWFIDEKLQNTTEIVDYKKIVNRESQRLVTSIENGIKLSQNKSKKIIVFLHFPPYFGDFICDEIIDVLCHYSIKDCYFGHIHGLYNIPQHTEYKGIKFTLISADFLNFVPYLVT